MKVGKRLLSAMLGQMLTIGSFGMTAEASKVVEIASTEVDSVYYESIDSNKIEGWAQGPQIYSETGIVMDVDSGAILYAKNIDDPHYPASITKVLTALVALRNYEMDEIVTFSWDDVMTLEYGASHIGIKENEELLMEDAMYGMMLASANEVANGIGSHMDGGYEAFLEEMNKVSAELGCTNSNWMNTNGLHNDEHYTSARDMALICSEAFQIEKFREIIKTLQYAIPETNITAEKRHFQQKHKMVWKSNEYYYEYCVGGKTGYTSKAMTTLVSFATKDDTNLVAVVMRTHGNGKNAYVDTKAMFEYAFNNFSKVSVKDTVMDNDKIAGVVENDCVMLPSGITTEQLVSKFVPPTEKKDRTGEVVFTYQDHEVGTVEVEITDEYYNSIHGIVEIKDDGAASKKKRTMPIVLKVILIVVGALIIGYFALVGVTFYKRRQKEKRRRARRMQRRRQMEAAMRRGDYE